MEAATAEELVGVDIQYVLKHEELFAFDVHGFIVLRGLLTATELAAAAAEGADSTLLATHPELLRYVHSLASPPLPADRPLSPAQRGMGDDCGRTAYLDTGLSVLPEIGPTDDEPPLKGGDGARFRNSRAWVRRFGKGGRITRYAQGLRAVWALSDQDADHCGLTLLPCSHTCGLPCPTAVRTGERGDLTTTPILRAGDCVLMSSNLAYGLRRWTGAPGTQHLLECEFVAPLAAPSTGIPLQPSLSADTLTPEEKVVLGITPPPPELRPAGEEEPPLDLYEWELNGFLVLRNILNPATIATALQAIEAHGGAGAHPLGDPIAWEGAEGAAFREMMMHPAVLRCLSWMEGPGFCEQASPTVLHDRSATRPSVT